MQGDTEERFLRVPSLPPRAESESHQEMWAHSPCSRGYDEPLSLRTTGKGSSHTLTGSFWFCPLLLLLMSTQSWADSTELDVSAWQALICLLPQLTCLSSLGAAVINIIDRVAYKLQKFVAHGSRDWKFKVKEPADSKSSKSPFHISKAPSLNITTLEVRISTC